MFTSLLQITPNIPCSKSVTFRYGSGSCSDPLEEAFKMSTKIKLFSKLHTVGQGTVHYINRYSKITSYQTLHSHKTEKSVKLL
jgi:hypothetical protein